MTGKSATHSQIFSQACVAGGHLPVGVSLMYPPNDIPSYLREEFVDNLLREHETEVRICLRKGAHKVQIDFPESQIPQIF